MKKYIAKTNISINVVLSTGANRHIAFSALSGGGSVFYTDDSEIIQAMERHYKFGTLFRADPRYIPEKPRNKPAPKPHIVPKQQPINDGDAPAQTTIDGETDSASAVVYADDIAPESEQRSPEDNSEADDDIIDDQNEDEAESNGLKKIVISDPDAAKAYLAEHFGYSRTKIKSLKAIKEAAAANGIVFEGI
ncbi:MAG: hypothetical protein HDR46_01025 [Bacteroides sp.]|nr:hypothetical protein [Bacteroides sp.]